MYLHTYIHTYIQRADLEAGKKPDKVMGAQAHKRTVAALQKQIAVQEKKMEEVRNWPQEFLIAPCLSPTCSECSPYLAPSTFGVPPPISLQHSYSHKLCVF